MFRVTVHFIKVPSKADIELTFIKRELLGLTLIEMNIDYVHIVLTRGLLNDVSLPVI